MYILFPYFIIVFLIFTSGCGIKATTYSDAPLTPPVKIPVVPVPDASAINVPEGYTVEAVITELTYPTSIEFDEAGIMYIAEAGYTRSDNNALPRLIVISRTGRLNKIFTGGLNAPINDLLWHKGMLYISHRGKISTIDINTGNVTDIVTGLPSFGDYQNNQLAAGPDGALYFGQGTATNSGIVGVDNFLFSWVPLSPEIRDIPAHDIELRKAIFTTINPFAMGSEKKNRLARTSPFSPFGKNSGTEVKGKVKANGTILRIGSRGGLEVYAWGLRNPSGLAWSSEGSLFCTEQGYEKRGSRPIANDGDNLYIIKKGSWYGWPDFADGLPVTDPRFKTRDTLPLQFLLKKHPSPEQPFMTFPTGTGVMKIAVAQSGAPEKTIIFVPLFGEVTSAHDRSGRLDNSIVRVDVTNKQYEPIIYNRNRSSCISINAGFRHPVEVYITRDRTAVYIVDFGTVEALEPSIPILKSFPQTGVVWRVVRKGFSALPPPGISIGSGKNYEY